MNENIKLSVQSIVAHKLRSLLTMLGIIVGIASVMTIFSIINGNTENMKKQIVGGSTNSMVIDYGPRHQFVGKSGGGGKVVEPAYTPEVPGTILSQIKQLPNVKNVSLVYTLNAEIFRKSDQTNATIMAIDQGYFEILTTPEVIGRLFLKSDYHSQRQICLITKELATKLFNQADPLNRMIEIAGVAYRIVGVVESQGKPWEGETAFIPSQGKITIEQKLNVVPKVLVQTSDADSLETAVYQASEKLTTLVPPSDYVFSIQNFDDVRRTTAEINQSNLLLLGGIASISLLVGGIGVMNTMLVTVTERTREIGLKKALGAKRKVILGQFLTEAIVLSGLGGLIGMVIGVIAGSVGTRLLGYPFMISYVALTISVTFSLGIGIFFGFIPAYKASKLSPIEALRFE